MDVVGIDLQPITLRTVWVEIEGETPLIVHRFSEKMKKDMAAAQGGKNQQPRKKRIRKPEEEWHAARYLFVEDGETKEGFPAVGVKKAMIDAGYRYVGLAKVDLRGDMHIERELIEIISPQPTMREDVVRLSGVGRTADLRYRPEYWPWEMSIPITFKPDRLSEERIVAMLSHAGFSVGLGEWRPEKDGNSGRFRVKGITNE